MAEQIRDALRHLEKDMADILDAMLDKKITEVILNPYQRFDGNYEGHILVDEHGVGLHNLYHYTHEDLPLVEVTHGDMLLLKESSGEIIYWVKLDLDDRAIIHKISTCCKYKLDEDMVITDENIDLLEFVDRIENHFNEFILNETTEPLEMTNVFDKYTMLVDKLNKKLPLSVNFKFKVKEILQDSDKILFKPYPNKICKARLVKLSATKAETIMSVLASITGKFIHNKSPYLECQIPKYGHRFTGVIPPVVPFPAFCIRKHTPHIYTLDDFVAQGVMEKTSRDTIISWIERKFNILIAGGTGSGKTTLANAILYEIARLFPDTRVLIIEDVPELQFKTSRSIAFTIGEFFSMYEALRTTLRFKPDRIVMGEVRGAEAYTLLKAWNTGHPGGVATIHANGVNEALYRFESCIRDHPDVKLNRQEIGFTVNGIISLQNITLRETDGSSYRNVVRRKVTALRQILQYDPDKDIYQDIIYDKILEDLS